MHVFLEFSAHGLTDVEFVHKVLSLHGLMSSNVEQVHINFLD